MSFSDEPKERIDQLQRLSQEQRSVLVREITRDLPADHKPWPFGMPTGAAPYIAVIGVSTGNSPAPSGGPTNVVEVGAYGTPTFGKHHPGFYYPDIKHYWDKIRVLCAGVVQRKAPRLNESACLAVSGHFNLGTGSFGEANDKAVEPAIVSWLSTVLNRTLPVRVLVCLGLKSILEKHNQLWNSQSGALLIEWHDPHYSYPFEKYRFDIWKVRRLDGAPLLACTWPNHPSRHPFAGTADNEHWISAVSTFCKILDEHDV